MDLISQNLNQFDKSWKILPDKNYDWNIYLVHSRRSQNDKWLNIRSRWKRLSGRITNIIVLNI